MSTDITPRPPISPADMLLAAIEKGIDPDGIRTLAAIHKEMEERRAESEYNAALAAFQAECPVILKRTQIEFPTRSGGKFTSRFAEMDDIMEQTRELRARHGFSFSFDRSIEKDQLTVHCEVRHRAGHKTRTPFSIPIPKDNRLSEAHAVAGAVTFAERYAFRGAFGITTGLPDNDGKAFTGGLCSEEQRKVLQALIDQVNPNLEKFFKYCGVTKLEELPERDFARVQAALLDAKKGGRSENTARAV